MPKKVLFIVAQARFDDNELRVLRDTLRNRGVVVAVAAPERRPASSLGGALLIPDLDLDNVRVSDYDAVVVVGGPGAIEELWGNRRVMQIVGGAALEHRAIAALGTAAVLPAQAELLVERDATCAAQPQVLAEMRKHRAHVVDLPVVETDGGIITARGADLAVFDELAHLLANRMGLEPAAEPQPPAPAPMGP